MPSPSRERSRGPGMGSRKAYAGPRARTARSSPGTNALPAHPDRIARPARGRRDVDQPPSWRARAHCVNLPAPCSDPGGVAPLPPFWRPSSWSPLCGGRVLTFARCTIRCSLSSRAARATTARALRTRTTTAPRTGLRGAAAPTKRVPRLLSRRRHRLFASHPRYRSHAPSSRSPRTSPRTRAPRISSPSPTDLRLHHHPRRKAAA